MSTTTFQNVVFLCSLSSNIGKDILHGIEINTNIEENNDKIINVNYDQLKFQSPEENQNNKNDEQEGIDFDSIPF